VNKDIDYAATVDEWESAQADRRRFEDSLDSWEATQAAKDCES
jgi:hypothetical protein